MSKNTIFVRTIIASLLTSEFSNTNLSAETIDYQTKIIIVNNLIGIKKYFIQMNIFTGNNYGVVYILKIL